MTIKTRISFKEYLGLLYGLAYRKPLMIVLLSFALFLLLWILTYYLHLLRLPEPGYFQFISLGLIIIVQPLVIYSTIWGVYYSSNVLRETLEIEVTADEIKLKGESFYTRIAWEKMYKIVETRNWYLVYQNSLSAIIIPKRFFHDDEESAFRNLLLTIPDIQLHLKKV
jgi:hypothetical protein